ncbi:MAG TPA: hypothetical protein DCZ95_09055 [Verrucomicrobia bacterium]|nr:MAG: hypothetical protein A2X46_03240 [Lentisphaerae bacterium GWF2_57_35]HBA84225.1 hypothetical protein [Verrucomicrobiota bacterium]
MEDLLRQYRRAARLNDWPECLRCLRQMVAVPNDGVAWQPDLDALETRIMDDIRDQLPAWIEKGRIDDMEQALKELAFCTDAPRKRILMAEVSRALDAHGRTRFLERGGVLLANAREAFEDQDRARLIETVRQYQKLNESIFFNPTAAMSAQFSELFEWYKDAVRDEEQQRHFDAALTELMAELAKPNPGHNLVQIWRRLQACGEDLSPALTDKAQKAVRKIERNRRTFRKLAVMAAGVGGIVLGTGVSSLIVHWQRRETQALVLSRLDAQWETNSPEAYIATMENVSLKHTFLLKRAEMRNRAERVGHFENLLRSRQTVFDQRLQSLRSVLDKAGSWDTEVLLKRRNEVDRLIQDANAALEALGPAIDPVRLRTSIENWSPQVPAEWRSAATGFLAWVESPRLNRADLDRALAQWEQFKTERQGRIDLAFTALIEQADVTLSGIDLQNAEEDVLLAPRQLLEKAARMQGVSSNLFASMNAVNQRADAVGSEILRRRQLMHDIGQANSLPGYLAAVQNYRDAFPPYRMSAGMGAVLARADFYKSILTPSAATNIPALAGPRAEWAALKSAREKNWPEVRAKLMSLGSEKRLVDLRAFTLGRWQNGVLVERAGFLEGEFSAGALDRRKGVVAAGIRPVVEGKTYFPGGNDVEPNFSFGTFNRGQGEYVGRALLMPHCRWVDDLLGVARSGAGEDFVPDLFLAQSAETLALREDIPPLLRLRLIQYLVEQLLAMTSEGGKPFWTDFVAAAARIGSEINWLCTENREVIVANTHAADILQRYFTNEGIARRYAYYVSALRETAGRAPVWAGYADWSENNPAPAMRPGITARELWIFRPNEAGTLWVVAALLQDQTWSLSLPLEPGEPLFAPNGPETTCEKLDRLRQQVEKDRSLSLPLATGWPQVQCSP